jgi:hypothetical protein
MAKNNSSTSRTCHEFSHGLGRKLPASGTAGMVVSRL